MGRSARAAGKNSDTLCFYFWVATIHVHISMYTYIQGLNVYWYMDIWYIICFQHMYLEPDKHWVFDPWSCLPSKATDIRVACKCTYVPCINEHIKYIYIYIYMYIYTYSLYIYKMYIYLIYMIIYIYEWKWKLCNLRKLLWTLVFKHPNGLLERLHIEKAKNFFRGSHTT